MKILLAFLIIGYLTSCSSESIERFTHCIIKPLTIEEQNSDNYKEEDRLPEATIIEQTYEPSIEQNNDKKPNAPTQSQSTSETKTDNSITKEENKIILTPSQIATYNKQIEKRTPYLYDIKNTTSMTASEISQLIEKYTMPTLPKFDGQIEISQEIIRTILDNRNLDEITDKNTIQRGIITKRSNLKSFPTDIHFYNNRGASNFDQIQETELTVNTPVIILHKSKDGLWYFVESTIYAGWVKKSDLAIASKSDWDFFTENPSFAVVTTPTIQVEGTTLDMGVKLPLNKISGSTYEVTIPIKADSGLVTQKNIVLDGNLLSVGYLPYTKENVIAQAKKYLGTPYSWGGMDYGVDCSSFIMNVYRTFGFVFPRNTSSQNTSIGTITSLASKTKSQKLAILDQTGAPAVLYQPGHTMLYIGSENGKHYIIHASGSEMKVTTTVLDDSSYINSIDKIIKVG